MKLSAVSSGDLGRRIDGCSSTMTSKIDQSRGIVGRHTGAGYKSD